MIEYLIINVLGYTQDTLYLGYLELGGTIFSLICVWLAVKQNIWTWFFGTLGVICFTPLFYNFQLYSDALLQVFFLVMQGVGWYSWMYLDNRNVHNSMEVKKTKYFLIICLSVIAAALINAHIMIEYTDASYPIADALITWMSIAAQILMLRKYIESWYLWISMDVVAISIYFLKGLFVTSGLYIIFLVLACYGLYSWLKSMKTHEKI